MESGYMIYSPDRHIPVLCVYKDANGIIHLVVKRPNKSDKDDMTLDEFLGLVYNAVA